MRSRPRIVVTPDAPDLGRMVTHNTTELTVSVGHDVGTGAWRIVVGLVTLGDVPEGATVTYDLGPADVAPLIEGLTIARADVLRRSDA